MKKLISLILAVLLTFSVVGVAFAAESSVPSNSYTMTEEEAIAKAKMYIEYKYYNADVDDYVYSDDSVTNKETYEVFLAVTLEDNTRVNYTAYIDKYDGTVYNKKAYYVIPIATVFTPLTADEAFDYTLKALCAEKENVIVLKKNEVKENDKVVSYSYEFVENFYIKHKATIDVNTGLIENISIAEPVNIIDRIILMIKVLFARLLGGSII